MSNILRFIKAQQGQNMSVSFSQAYAELEAGGKQSHWIWYIFPQLKQLGFSAIAQHFGIIDFKEACEYLQNKELFGTYHAMVQLVEQQLERKIPVRVLMGGETDTKKLVSSLTLFREAAYFLLHHKDKHHDFAALIRCCEQILEEVSKQGYVPCERTLDFLHAQKKPYR